MKDIAEKLNISVNAVSIALNDKVGVSEETRNLVVNLLHPIEDEASYFIDRCLLLFTAGLTQSP
ncbi:helix-turn-helix domain-containing protein [Thermoanaerobacterium thermosaccharolyticum]|uniref:helix-turn-helix domain-containing protein n=1 Tax=Thermoanaerobacterium thermosaccharolyticum TaxID=1517 RepID=UPI003D79BD36